MKKGDNNTLGAVQKLRSGQRGEGVDDFVAYRYIYLRGRGGTQRAQTSIFSALWNHQNEKYR